MTDAGAHDRFEEQLRVGHQTVVAGRVRLRKYTVTEERTFTVSVAHGEIAVDHVEIPPADRVPDGGGLAEETVEVVRYEEQVVITPVLVPVERVRLVTQVVTGEHVVTGEVRVERIDVVEP